MLIFNSPVDLEHAYSCGRQSEQKVKLLFNSLVDLEHTYSCGRQANQKVRHESAAESSSSNTIRTGNLIIECDRNEEDFVESCASNDRSVPVASSSRLQQAVSINLNSNVSGRSSTSSAASHYFLPSTAVDALPVQISDISSTSTSIDENLLSTDESVFRTE